MLTLVAHRHRLVGGNVKPENRPPILVAQGMIGTLDAAAFGQAQPQFELNRFRARIADLDARGFIDLGRAQRQYPCAAGLCNFRSRFFSMTPTPNPETMALTGSIPSATPSKRSRLTPAGRCTVRVAHQGESFKGDEIDRS